MITVRECQYDEVKKFRDLEGEYHYMGFSRVGHSRDFFIRNDSPKVLYVKGFTRDAWETIVANDLPDEYDVAAHSRADGVLPCSPKQVESLYWELCHAQDPRKRNKSVGFGTAPKAQAVMPAEQPMRPPRH